MRLKKVFAGALAAAMLVCAVAVPAFAAEEVEQENCLSSSYVQMNIPYADFYKAAGVDNASKIDAVILGAISSTTVTRKYTPYSNQVIVLLQGKLFSGWFNANIINTIATISIITPIILDILFFM